MPKIFISSPTKSKYFNRPMKYPKAPSFKFFSTASISEKKKLIFKQRLKRLKIHLPFWKKGNASKN